MSDAVNYGLLSRESLCSEKPKYPLDKPSGISHARAAISCGENFNNIDLMMIQGHDFVAAVEILKNWLEQYRRDLGRSTARSS